VRAGRRNARGGGYDGETAGRAVSGGGHALRCCEQRLLEGEREHLATMGGAADAPVVSPAHGHPLLLSSMSCVVGVQERGLAARGVVVEVEILKR
jgi:hypothetical protein